MIETGDIWPDYYAVIGCDAPYCDVITDAINTNSVDDAIARARDDAKQNGWTLDGDKHYCPEHRP